MGVGRGPRWLLRHDEAGVDDAVNDAGHGRRQGLGIDGGAGCARGLEDERANTLYRI
jgi:hypothetical protein